MTTEPPRGTGHFFEVPCGLVVTTIGYRATDIGELPLDPRGNALLNDDGQVDGTLFVVGWLKRGPSGKIATNRLDGEQVAARILNEVVASGKPGFAGLRAELERSGVRWTDFDHWRRIDAAEIMAAPAGAPRRKITDIEELLTMFGD